MLFKQHDRRLFSKPYICVFLKATTQQNTSKRHGGFSGSLRFIVDIWYNGNPIMSD